MEETSKKTAVDKINVLVRQLAKNWAQVKNADNIWDFRNFAKALTACTTGVDELTLCWSEYETELVAEMQQNEETVASENYRLELEEALLAAGIPLQGEFPQYELTPFKLNIAIEEKELCLAIGRKREKTTALQPKQAAKWVAAHYQKLINKRFDSTAVMKELLGAYRLANRLAYREGEVLWGRAVGLEDLYELLTLKRGSRVEYPKPLFLFELGRLKEQPEMKFDDYQFEFGFPRKQEKALAIFDSRGRESKVSSLTIYKAVEG